MVRREAGEAAAGECDADGEGGLGFTQARVASLQHTPEKSA